MLLDTNSILDTFGAFVVATV